MTVKSMIFKKNDLENAAKKFLKLTEGHRKMAFYGEMGVGKTTFVGAVCRALGVEKPTASPTFSLINQYIIGAKKEENRLIYHLDLYRLKTVEEAINLDLEGILYDKNWCFIEWPQIIESYLPENILKIKLETIDENTRRLLIL
jgi:tRNA threonylcarbamoyladenosine biosynthesis protein TsaE